MAVFTFARGQLHLLLDDLARLRDVAADVAAVHVNEHVAGEQPVFVAYHRRSGSDPDRRDAAERNLPLALGGGHEHATERVEVGAEIAHVADVHRIALAPFDGRRDVLAADRILHYRLRFFDPEAVARQRV